MKKLSAEKILKIMSVVILIGAIPISRIWIWLKYDDYDSDTKSILSIIFLIFAITIFALLRVISNISINQSKTTNQFSDEKITNEVRKLIVLGEKENAKKLIINLFVERIYQTKWAETDTIDIDGINAYNAYNNEKFISIKEQFVEYMNLLGESVPEDIMKLKSIEDFLNVFRPKISKKK